MVWNILCDFDGTVTSEPIIGLLLERFADPAWREIERDCRAGRIGARECMTRQIGLLDCSRTELDSALDSVTIDPDFAAFAQDCRERGHHLVIAGDGLDYAILRILRRHHIAGVTVAGNHLVMRDQRRFAVTFPHARLGCRALAGTCKCQLTAPGHRKGSFTVAIGHRRSDFCLIGQVDLLMARGPLLEYARARRLQISPFDNFADVRHRLDDLHRQGPVQPARTNSLYFHRQEAVAS